MEEEEETHTVVDKETETAEDEVEAKETTTMERAALLRDDFTLLLVPACSTTYRSWQQNKQDHHGRTSYNTLARITDKIEVMNYKIN